MRLSTKQIGTKEFLVMRSEHSNTSTIRMKGESKCPSMFMQLQEGKSFLPGNAETDSKPE